MLILIQAVQVFFRLLRLLILARIILSWVPNIRYSGVVRFIYDITEPIMGPVRELLFRYLNMGMFDFSPMIVWILLQVVESAVVRLLWMMV